MYGASSEPRGVRGRGRRHRAAAGRETVRCLAPGWVESMGRTWMVSSDDARVGHETTDALIDVETHTCPHHTIPKMHLIHTRPMVSELMQERSTDSDFPVLRNLLLKSPRHDNPHRVSGIQRVFLRIERHVLYRA